MTDGKVIERLGFAKREDGMKAKHVRSSFQSSVKSFAHLDHRSGLGIPVREAPSAFLILDTRTVYEIVNIHVASVF